MIGWRDIEFLMMVANLVIVILIGSHMKGKTMTEEQNEQAVEQDDTGEDEASWQEPEPNPEPPADEQTHNTQEGERESEEG